MSKPKKMLPVEKQVKCPMCGEERGCSDAKEYECPQCGATGFDCCVAGNNCICVNCEESAEEDL